MKTIVRSTLAGVMAVSICLSAWAAVTASLDKSLMVIGERVRLVLQNTGNGDRQPDTTALRNDFDILGTQRASGLQINNGHMSSLTTFTVLLAPKHSGTIRIAPIQWGGEQSDALELTVGASADPNKPGSHTNAAETQITLSGTLDQKHPYVQSAVVLNLRLNVGVQMTQASLDFQGNSDVLVRQIGKDLQHTESRNGRDYQVIERKYLLIPQRSGAISLKGPILQAQVQDDAASAGDSDIDAFFGSVFGRSMGRFVRPMRTVRLQSEPIEMNVQPRPLNADASNWLPAKNLALEETWQPVQTTLHVGEPLTRHLHLTALGVTAGQLPDLASMMVVPEGIKKYPDQAKTDEGLKGESVHSSRDQDIVLIASAPGTYVLPAFHLVWWDTVNRTQHTIELPERSLVIVPAIAVGASVAGDVPQISTPQGTSGSMVDNSSTKIDTKRDLPSASAIGKALGMSPIPWFWISAALVVLWLGTLMLWWRAHRMGVQRTPVADAKSNALVRSHPVMAVPAPRNANASLAALQRACSANDPQLARQHLLEWASVAWPQSPPRGLNSLAERLKDTRYAQLLQQLDRACYTPDASWTGAALAHVFSEPPKPIVEKMSAPIIPDLYD